MSEHRSLKLISSQSRLGGRMDRPNGENDGQTPEDIAEELVEFRESHADDENLAWKLDTLVESIEDLNFFEIRDVAPETDANDQLLGIAGILSVGSFDPSTPQVEFGGTILDPEIRGFGLQRLLFAVRTASLAWNWVHSWPPTWTVIAPDAVGSVINASRFGFSEIQGADGNRPEHVQADRELFEACANCDKREPDFGEYDCCSNIYRLFRNSAAVRIRRLLTNTENDSVLEFSNGDQTIELELDLKLLSRSDRRRTLQEAFVNDILHTTT